MNEVTKIENNDIMSKFQKTENILNDVQNIIADCRQSPRLFAEDFAVLKRLKVIFKTFRPLFGIIKVSKKGGILL